jgi:hypothetical protein
MAVPVRATLDEAKGTFSADVGTWVVFDGPKGGEDV